MPIVSRSTPGRWRLLEHDWVRQRRSELPRARARSSIVATAQYSPLPPAHSSTVPRPRVISPSGLGGCPGRVLRARVVSRQRRSQWRDTRWRRGQRLDLSPEPGVAGRPYPGCRGGDHAPACTSGPAPLQPGSDGTGQPPRSSSTLRFVTGVAGSRGSSIVGPAGRAPRPGPGRELGFRGG